MFTKLLIANRGEIAVRISRTCRRLGIRVVAVYSEAEANAPHVRAADEAVCVGAASVAESYLNVPAIIAAAKQTRAEAVHPGYGLLSENPAFARAVVDSGLVWVGPRPDAIAAMGNKLTARLRMVQAGVPVTPGTTKPVDEDGLEALTEWLGLPLMVKASEGGGGIGMQIVRSADQLRSAVRRARSAAGRAFGSQEVYLERYVESGRHVEVQVLGDEHGNLVHLFERECSVQRRHQKLIEETPSPVVTPDLRGRMTETALRAARAVGYTNAGTVECLVDRERNFYFLEMNTRLQVEHPVTELTTGIDVVEQQLHIAAGEPLSFAQDDVRQNGHAIECRVYAEDPRSFLPSPGKLTVFRPPAGEHVRVDSGAEEGMEVLMYYDPLLAKVAVWAETRPDAIARAAAALRDFEVAGVKTNLPLLIAVLDSDEFGSGDYHAAVVQTAVERLGAPAGT